MYNLTAEQLVLFWEPLHQSVTLTYEDDQGDTQTITQANILENSFVLNRASSTGSNIELGAAIMAELDFILDNAMGQFNSADLLGKEMFAKVQVSNGTTTVIVPLGYFTVDEAPKKATTISVVTFDRMARFDKPATELATAGVLTGHTAQWLISRICTLCGVPFNSPVTASYPANYTTPTLTEPDNWVELANGNTYRQLLMWVLERCGCAGFINHSGEFTLGQYTDTAPANIVDLTTANRLSSDLAESEIAISGFVANVGDNVYTNGTDAYRLVIDQNPLFDDATAQTLIDNINTKLNGYHYRPFTATVLPTPNLEPCDPIYFTEANGTKHISLAMNWTYKLNGSTAISSTGDIAASRGYASGNQLTKSEQAVVEKIRKATNAQLSGLELASTHMNELAANTLGYYMTEETLSDGSKITYWHDKPTFAQSIIIYKRGADGFFLSQDGGATYTQGFDSSGNAVLNILDAIGINADWVRTGSITSTSGTNYWDLDNGRFRLVSPDGYTDINLAGDSNGSYISVTDTTSYAQATLRGKAGSLILSHSEDNGASYTEVGSVWIDGSDGSSNANIDFYRVGRYHAAPTVDLRRNQLIARWDYTANKSYTYGNEFLIRPDAGVYNQTTVFTIAKWNSDLSTTEIRAGLYSFKSPDAVYYSLVDWDTTKASAGTHLRVSYATISEAGITTVNATTVNAAIAKATTFRTVNGEAIAWSSATGDNYVRAYNYQVGNETTHKDIAWLNSAGTTVYIRAGFYSFTSTSGTNHGVIYSDSSNRICFYGHLYYAGSSDDTTERGFYVRSAAGSINFISNPTNNVRGIYVNAHGTGSSIYPLSVDTNNVVTFRGQTYNAGTDSDSTNEGAFYATSSAGKIHLYSNPNSSAAPRGLWISAHGTGSSKSIIYADANNNVFVDGKTPVYTSTDQTIEGSKYFNTLTMRVSTNYPEVNFQGRSGTTTGKTGTLTQEVTATYNRFYFNMYHMANGVQQNSYVDIYRLPVSGTDNASHTYDILTSKSAVTVAQGGTGATSAESALNNIGGRYVFPHISIAHGASKKIALGAVTSWCSMLITGTVAGRGGAVIAVTISNGSVTKQRDLMYNTDWNLTGLVITADSSGVTFKNNHATDSTQITIYAG